MPDLAKSGLFSPGGFEDETGLPGISTRLLAPTETKRVDENLSVIAVALKNLGIARRTERDAGSWTITGTPLASGDDWQEWAATHKGTDERARARIVSFHRGTPVLHPRYDPASATVPGRISPMVETSAQRVYPFMTPLPLGLLPDR